METSTKQRREERAAAKEGRAIEMKGVTAGVAITIAALLVGANAAEISTFMEINEEQGYTLEELKTGKFLDTQKSASRIINGSVVRRRTLAPYIASVFAEFDGTFYFVCSGAVVDTYVAITAAHCVDLNTTSFLVCVSSVDLTQIVRCVPSGRVKVPKKYFTGELNSGPENAWTHDIALIKTKSKMIQRGSKAMAIPVDIGGENTLGAKMDRLGYIYGFGFSNPEATELTGKLRNADVMWKRFDKCVDFDSVDGKNFVCANGNYDGSLGSSCNGDSGGPLVWSSDGSEDPATHVLEGVLSFGFIDPEVGPSSCNVNIPSGYTRTSSPAQSTWLVKAMAQLRGNFTLYSPE